jgi:serine/threonine protein kinase
VDFGLTCEGTSKRLHTTTSARGTECYRAPELMASIKATYNNKVDIWSIGCILYEIATGQLPFNSDWDVIQYRQSSEKMGWAPIAMRLKGENTTLNNDLATLISEMLHSDSSCRPTARFVRDRFSQLLGALPRMEVDWLRGTVLHFLGTSKRFPIELPPIAYDPIKIIRVITPSL